MNDYVTVLYSIYLMFVIGASIYVGKTLFTHSKIFMESIFNGRILLSTATNKLFEMGFFLIAFGVGFYSIKIYGEISAKRDLFETLSTKAGGFTFFLGGLLLLHLLIFFKGMKYRKKTDSQIQVTVK